MQVLDHHLCSDGGTAVPESRSPNHGGLLLKPTHILLHYTAGANAESSINWLCDPRAKASAHLLIAQNGHITQLLPFNLRAWHAGVSSYAEPDGTVREHFNDFSIGIELDNPGRLTLQPTGEWWSVAVGKRYPREMGVSLTHKHEHRPSGWHIYPEAQVQATFEAVHALMHVYPIKEVLGHEDVAPGRKFDPGPAFPMDTFQSRLFGRSEHG